MEKNLFTRLFKVLFSYSYDYLQSKIGISEPVLPNIQKKNDFYRISCKSRKSKNGLFQYITIFLLCFSAMVSWAQATVTTDRTDYSPGFTVIITGSNWQPGEQVQLVLNESPILQTHTLSATADSNGNIYNNAYIVQPEDLGQTFNLIATGQSSGLTAMRVFTDSKGSYSLTFLAADPAVNKGQDGTVIHSLMP